MGDEMNQKLTDLSKKMVEDVREEMFDSITGEDDKLREKVAYFYFQFAGDPTTKEEMKERMENAYILATGGKGKVSLSGDMVSGVVGKSYVQKNENQMGKLSDQTTVDVAKKLGITAEELKRNGLI
jgi:hypothetical protein